MFLATATCNFSSLIWPASSAPAALASLLFRPSGATNHWKNTVFCDFPTYSRTWIFFLLALSLFDLLSSSLLLSDSSHLCFSSVHIIGSLTFKLPSVTYTYRDHHHLEGEGGTTKPWTIYTCVCDDGDNNNFDNGDTRDTCDTSDI